MAPGSQSHWQEALYRERAAELILYGRALGLSHAEAEDVLQDIFVQLLERPNPPANPPHYLVRSFRNRALNYRRSFWRRLTREFESRHWFETGPAETETERAAIRCLTELPAPQREVIVLKFWHELTFEEIGQLLQIPPNTAAGRYRYGMTRLRACLKGELHERIEFTGKSYAIVAASPPCPPA
jgi:RNA polymerase sigma-70 factor, ECF subfamily